VADIDRGQIILVAAFALGVIFIALAVVVNTAIFTENLATRTEATDGSDALEFRHELQQSIAEILEAVNDDGGDQAAFESNVSELDNQSSYWQAGSGRIVSTEVVSTSNGRRFYQDSGARFDSGGDDWIVAESLDQSRAIELNITDESALSGSVDSAFTFSVNDTTGDYWNMSVYESGGDVVVSVELDDGTTAACSTSTEDPRIDVTGGTVGGEPCTALRLADGTGMYFGTDVASPYDLVFYNGTQIEGTYEGIKRGGVILPAANAETVLYSGTVRYIYETSAVSYRTDIEVAPGEPQ
jgi:hypothetical protein